MTEHVHPNIDGNFLMAQSFFDGIIKSEVIGKKNNGSPVPLEYYKKNWGYTALDSLLAHHRIQLLKGFWPFVKDAKNEYNYREKYRPKSYLDSLAFTVMINSDLSLDEARLDLAKKYEKTGQIEKAYREYEALLRTNPYLAVNYRDAANCLLQLFDLPLALKYFQKSLEYEESFFARYRIGEIYLLMGDYNNAAAGFEKSFSQAPDDKKVNVLAKSYIAFVYAGKTEQAKAVAKELERVKATQYLSVPPKNYVYTNYVPFQTREQVNTAKQLINENRNDEALALLESSLLIYDSHVASRMIGEIYQGEQNNEKALFYFKKVYNQFRFDPRFLSDYALIYIALNDKVNARKCIEEIKLIDPEYEQLGQLNSLLSSTN
jgi:tetratricopeptide (TPR) repeat protein